MERRYFLKTCFLACAAGAVTSAALAGCKSIYYAQASIADKVLSVKKTEFTDEKGKARGFVVVRNDKLEFPIVIYKSTDMYTALSTKCTHSGCEIVPNAATLVCPCHGSEFSNTGKVLNPPAETDLKSYTVTTTSEDVLIQI